ncbi:Herc6, partial [Symbiodinium sp. KB8]
MASGNLDFLAIVMAARSMVGRAYAWGSNDQGEAGIGRLAPAGMTGPAQIESLRRLHAPVFLAAGSKHAAALTGESQLFVWGRNMEGQCALGPKAKRSMRPYLVKGLKSFQVTHVACGHTHTVAVVSTGEAFAWGSSDSGALGIGPPTEEDEEAATKAAARGEDTSGEIVMTRHEPVRMVDIGPDFGRHAALVTAGRSTTAVQTAQGECLVCGSNSTGQLGFGIDQLGLTFHEVRPARLEGYSHIQQVELGDTFSAFVVDDGVLLLTGVLGVTPEEFAERRKETAWLIDNCDAPSPRTLFMERPLVRCIATSGEHLVVVCKYTDQHFAGGVVGNPSAPVATGSGDAAEPGVEELPPNDEQLFHVYTAGRGYLGCKPDHPDLTLLKNAGGVEVHLPDGSKALRDAVGEVVTPGFGWSPRLVPVPALQGQDIDEVACGDRFTLARTRDGRVYAWGDNDNGQLGNGCYINTDEPMEASEVDMGNTHSEQVVAGGDFAMTLQFDGCKGFKQERYLSRKYGMLWMDKVFGADRHKRHGVADQFDRDFGGEMAAAVQEYADDQGISDVLGDATL